MKYGKKILAVVLLLLLGTGMLTAAAGSRTGDAQVRTERDLQLQSVTMEELEEIREREKGGMTGLLNIAGWRYGEAGNVKEPLSGKKAGAGTVYVNGPVSLAFPAKVLSGSYESVMGKKDCVLTRELSWSLFGSVDTAGCQVDFGGKTYTVTAVIDKEEMVMFLTADDGAVQKAAFSFSGRERIDSKMKALGFE